jgi:hypothetical protein
MADAAPAVAAVSERWSAVLHFYSAYHLMMGAVRNEPLFEDADLLNAFNEVLRRGADDEHRIRQLHRQSWKTRGHEGGRTASTKEPGLLLWEWALSPLVRVIYEDSVSEAYDRLLVASIDSRYDAPAANARATTTGEEDLSFLRALVADHGLPVRSPESVDPTDRPVISRRKISVEQHQVESEYHMQVAQDLEEVAEDWARVAYFYSALHAVTGRVSSDPRAEQSPPAAIRGRDLIRFDPYEHRGYYAADGSVMGRDDIVREFASTEVATAWDALHRTSRKVRYEGNGVQLLPLATTSGQARSVIDEMRSPAFQLEARQED